MSEINTEELEQAAKAATPGPWRWEFNAEHKRLHLVGGRPQYDLTIMDFDRWGMGGAVATLRDTSEDGMNIMHRLCDRPDWIAPFAGRAHHASWCSDVTHPDMRLIATANPSTILSLIDRVKKAEAERDALAARLAESERHGEEPVFWYRPRSDGQMHEGPIHNAQIERVRRLSGAWVPLYARRATAQPVRLTEADLEECKRLADAGSPAPRMSWSQRLAFAIEAAVLERNGLKPQAKGD